jgi:signal peptidase I
VLAAPVRDSHLLTAVIEKALTAGTTVRFRAEGTSMYPTIRDGEAISIAAVSPEEVVRGDVLLCRHSTRVMAHRVVNVTTRDAGRVFELRGDAKAGCDAPVGADDVIGRVIAVRRNGRLVRLCGRAARVRHKARTAASGARLFVISAATNLSGAILSCRSRRLSGDDGLRI